MARLCSHSVKKSKEWIRTTNIDAGQPNVITNLTTSEDGILAK